MHESVARFAADSLSYGAVGGRHVLDVGAYDVNGSLRGLVSALGAASYRGVDIRPGPGVDEVCDAADLTAESCDLVISAEMLEHARDWQAALAGMVRALRPGGLLLLTTRSQGFSRHNHPDDYWRFTCPLLAEALVVGGHLDLLRVQPDPDHPGVFILARRSDTLAEPDFRAWAAWRVPPA